MGIKPHIAIYPGTFDPVTYGHLDIIKRAANIFDHLVVAVAIDSTKKTIFSAQDRVEMLVKEVEKVDKTNNITIESFKGLLVNFAVNKNARILVRGLRAVSDFEYEFQMSYMNHKLNHDVETVLLPATENSHFISSSFVKEIARLGGSLDGLVSQNVSQLLRNYYKS